MKETTRIDCGSESIAYYKTIVFLEEMRPISKNLFNWAQSLDLVPLSRDYSFYKVYHNSRWRFFMFNLFCVVLLLVSEDRD
jgi:hypothetical protein